MNGVQAAERPRRRKCRLCCWGCSSVKRPTQDPKPPWNRPSDAGWVRKPTWRRQKSTDYRPNCFACENRKVSRDFRAYPLQLSDAPLYVAEDRFSGAADRCATEIIIIIKHLLMRISLIMQQISFRFTLIDMIINT